jgi:hypothetical protein
MPLLKDEAGAGSSAFAVDIIVGAVQFFAPGGMTNNIPKIMKTIKTFLAAIILVVLTGCASSSFRSFNTHLLHLQQGMTKDQVVQLLGSPTVVATGTHYVSSDSSSNGFSEVFRYARSNGGQTDDWLVVFVDGKVSEYGPYVGDLRTRYGSVFLNQ